MSDKKRAGGGSSAGYSGTPLGKKLGLKSGMRCAIDGAPEGYWEGLEGRPDDLTLADLTSPDLDFVHLFARRKLGLEDRLASLRKAIAQNGMIWVSWPKKSSGVASELTDGLVRRAGLAAGLVDVKVCAVDETWSALKFVIRKADRR